MLSDCKEAGLDLHHGSVPISVRGDLGMIALTRQADVMVIAGGSGAASLVKLTTSWERGFSKFRWSTVQFISNFMLTSTKSQMSACFSRALY